MEIKELIINPVAWMIALVTIPFVAREIGDFFVNRSNKAHSEQDSK